MNAVRKAALLAVVTGFAAGGLLAASAPASAAASLDCWPGTLNRVNYVFCDLIGAATPSHSKWTFDHTYFSTLDNQTSVKLACGATGAQYIVNVTFTAAGGAPAAGTRTGTCGGMAT